MIVATEIRFRGLDMSAMAGLYFLRSASRRFALNCCNIINMHDDLKCINIKIP